MVSLTVLLIVLLVIATIVMLTLGVGFAGLVLAFGDVIVFAVIIALLIKYLRNRRR